MPQRRFLWSFTFCLGAAVAFVSFQNCTNTFSPPQQGAAATPNTDTGSTDPNPPPIPSVTLACAGGIHTGALVVNVNTVLTESCIIAGDLTVKNDAVFQVDYSSKSNNRFIVRGNVLAESNSQLVINGKPGGDNHFVIANEYSQQRNMMSKGSATISIKQMELRTQEQIVAANGSLDVNYNAYDTSKLIVENSKLVLETAWLLAYFHDSSQLKIIDSQGIPSENYIYDSSNIKVSGPTTHTGFWLNALGAKGILNLPDMNSPFSWKVGKANGLDVGWLLDIENSQPGLGIEIRTGTDLEINGNGTSAPIGGELKIGYYIENASETLVGLDVGIQNRRISPRLKLNNVQLGPIAWAIYPGENATVNIQNSKINEIGISGMNTNVSVSGSILQLAVLGVMAPTSQMNITNSDIWNQSIRADGGGKVNITGSQIHGSQFLAISTGSTIAISNSAFFANPSGCTQGTMVNMTTGEPQCNPFRPPGMPTKAGSGQVTCQNTSNCNF